MYAKLRSMLKAVKDMLAFLFLGLLTHPSLECYLDKEGNDE